MRAYIALGFALVFAAAACGSSASPPASGAASAAPSPPAASVQPSPSPSPAASPSSIDSPSPSPSLSPQEAAGLAYLEVAQALADAQAEAAAALEAATDDVGRKAAYAKYVDAYMAAIDGTDAIAFPPTLDEKSAALVDALDTVRSVYDFLTEEGKLPRPNVAEDLARFSAAVRAADEAIRADLGLPAPSPTPS